MQSARCDFTMCGSYVWHCEICFWQYSNLLPCVVGYLCACHYHSYMLKKLKSLLSVFGASGYRYSFTLFSFDKVNGVEDAFPDEGAVFLFARRAFDLLRMRFTYELIYCGATKDLSALSVGKLSKHVPALVGADCIGVIYKSDSRERSRVVADIVRRNFT